MTQRRTSRWCRFVLCAALFSVYAAPLSATTNAKEDEARKLIAGAKDAYFSLNIDTAKISLSKALSMATQLERVTVAEIYVVYGVMAVAGAVDASKAKRHFMIANCLDSKVPIDPLLMTPEVELIFNLAKRLATEAACKDVLALPLLANLKKAPPPKAKTPAPAKPKPAETVKEPVEQATLEMVKRRVESAAPDYPKAARRDRIESTITVQIEVDRDGKVAQHKFIDGSPLFHKSVEKALRKWRFSAYEVAGKPVATTSTFKFTFKLE